jgi:hypothetical protein
MRHGCLVLSRDESRVWFVARYLPVGVDNDSGGPANGVARDVRLYYTYRRSCGLRMARTSPD